MTINASHIIDAYVGDVLSIVCIVASLPQSDNYLIRWYKNNLEVPYEIPPDVKHIDYTEGSFNEDHCQVLTTLNIRNLTYEDSGNYTCKAAVTDHYPVIDTIILMVKEHKGEPVDNYKSLIIKIGIPVSVYLLSTSND